MSGIDRPGPPNRLLMTADTVGGVWTFALELARGLSGYGIEVALATMGAPLSPEQRTEASYVPRLEVYESYFKLEWMPDPWEEVADAGAWLLGLERRLDPDLVHLNSYVHANLPWHVPALVTGHSCVLSWWKAVKGTPAPPEWDRYRRAVGQGLAAASLVVTPTEAMRRALQENYPRFPAGPVIPNGRTDLYQQAPKEPFILSVGRLWDEGKNLAALDRVAPDLPWPVYAAGDDHAPGGAAVALPNVHQLGRLGQDALVSWFERAAIYALPAKYEPFGLSALEAAQAGCALVLGDIPSLREVWAEAALYVPPDDSAALAGALRALIEDDARRAEFARKAQARALLYTPERMTDAYLGAYRGLLAQVITPPHDLHREAA